MHARHAHVRSLRIAEAAGLFTLVSGVAVLAGWAGDIRWLMQVRAAWTPMVPLTAATFALAGAGLFALTRARAAESATTRIWRGLSVALGVAVAGVGARRLLYYTAGWPSPIDMLGFTPPSGPGAMAFLTALAFTLTGAALAMSARPRLNPAAQWLAAGVLVLGWMSLARYLYGGKLEGVFVLMAAHTALLFSVLGLGVFFTRPDGGFVALWNGHTAGSLLVRRLLPTALVMPVFVGWLRLLGERAGWYGLETGLAIFATSNVVIFVALAWHTGGRLQREDIARREAEDTLREEKRFSDGLLDSLPGVFYFYDKTGRFLRWNRNFEKVSGYTGAEIAHMHPSQFIAPADRERLATRIAEVFTRGESDLEAGFLTKDGREIPYYFTGMTISLAGETCLAGVGIDISARRAAENAVRELNAELEKRVEERTGQLHAKNRELETFTYSVSHDLKAPLRGIDGYSRLLQEDYHDKLDEEGKRFLASVRQACGQMAQLIDDLLAYSRLERRELQPTRIPLRDLVDSELALHSEAGDGRNVELKVDIPEVTVWADLAGLNQAVRNLIDNAFKFTRAAAHPRIEISARIDDGRCILAIADNGVGFDMKFAERIFDIFQRLHRAEDYPGTGVGLAIVRKAMERMGGRAWTRSEPGKGTTFFLEIPLAPAPATA